MAHDILWICISVPLTIAITAVVNWILNRPKKIKEQRDLEAQERKELKDKQDEMMRALNRLCKDQDAEHKAVTAEREEILQKLSDIQEGNHLLKKGVQLLIRDELRVGYDKWIAKGFAPPGDKKDLEDKYQIYHKLGQNGIMDHRREIFLDLPDEKVVEKKRTSSKKVN